MNMHRAILSTCLFIGLVVLAAPARAAEFRVVTDTHAFDSGALFEAGVVVDAQGESINAFEGTITFPHGVLTPLEVRDGGSLVNFWIERPRISATSDIRFSGIVPGGFMGRGPLFSVLFRTTKPGSGTIAVTDSRALRDDGEGSSAPVTNVSARITVSSTVIASESVPPIQDTEPPEPFTPVITRDQALFDGSYALIFATQDKKSGIDRYEVCEGNIRQCAVAESPYALRYQDLSRNIFVKAIDKAGNKRIAALPAFMHLPWQQVLLLLAILVGVLMWALASSRRFL